METSIFGVCAWGALLFSGVLVSSMRRKARLAALFLLYLLAGLACLQAGATLLGFGLWMTGTLLSLAWMLHVPVFGDRDEHRAVRNWDNLKRLSPVFVTVLLMVAAGLYSAGGVEPLGLDFGHEPARPQSKNVHQVASQLVVRDWLKVQVVGVLLLVSVVGAGVTSRAEASNGSGNPKKDDEC